jgi:cholesterol transport system auxiliary component
MKRTPMLIAALALASLAGCVSLERDYPEKHYYALSVERKAAARPTVPKAILRVLACRVAPGFDKTPIVVRKSEHAYESRFYDEFFLPPSDMVTAATRDWLARSGLFEEVVTSGSLVDAPLVLETSVGAIYGDFREGGKPAAVLVFQALLLREGADGPRIVLDRTYRESAPLGEATASGIAAGLDVALAAALAALEADLAKADLAGAVGGGSPAAAPQHGK